MSEAVLQELKKQVHVDSHRSQQSAQGDASAENTDSQYEDNFSAFRSVIAELEIICNAACKEIECHLQKSDDQQSYRICSLGCGNGKLDKQILQQLTEKCPGVKFEYVGLDNNQASLKVARSTLIDMSFASVEYHDLEGDVQALSKFSKFDAVIAVHLMCYLKSKASLLPNFVALLKPSGVLFAIHSAVDDPLCKLTEVFLQDHEKACYMLPKDDVLSRLAEMKEKCEIHEYTPEDHTAIFEKQKFYQNNETRDRVLDFIVHVPLEKYPSNVKELCLKYLNKVHEETHGRMIRMNSFTIWNK